MDLQALSDRAALTDLVYRYGVTIDRRDLDGLADCFAMNAIAEYDGGIVLHGRTAIRAFMEAAFREHLGLSNPTSHLMTNTLIDLHGDEAVLTTTAIACLTQDEGQVIVRGLRYSDRCVREERWRFSHRRHEADWGFAADSSFINRITPQTAEGRTHGPD